MALKKDKQKVFGGSWSEEKLRNYLTATPLANCSDEFSIVYKAYQQMLPEHFEQFIALYEEEGLPKNPQNQEGETILDVILQHSASVEYADILKAHNFDMSS